MQSEQVSTETGTVWSTSAWTVQEIRRGIHELLERFSDRLPVNRDARILIKPNLNNDLVALTGNSTDLRVLSTLTEALIERGYRNITIADGSNVGVDRRGINAFRRLRIDALAARLSVNILNLNHDDGQPITLCSGAKPRVSTAVQNADFLINVPTVKTHVEAGLSCAMKNWVGIVVGQDKRQMHYAINRNIQALNEHVKPDLIVVDGIVGMEGNGPGDGDPVRLGFLVGATSSPLCDLAVSRMIGLSVSRIPYLGHAMERGMLSQADLDAVESTVSLRVRMEPAPERNRLAMIADDPRLGWLKQAVRPLTDQPSVAKAAYKLGMIQDVYSPQDDGITGIRRSDENCMDCTSCADVCPTGLPLERIGRDTQMPDCIGCLYCWWVCPDDSIELDGPMAAMERQAARYKTIIEHL